MFNRLRKLVFAEEQEKPASDQVPQASAAARPSETASVATSTSSDKSGSEIVNQILDELRSDVDQRSSAGYEAFTTNMTALDGVVPDKKNRIRAALKTARVNEKSVTVPDLIAAVEQRLAILVGEEDEFKSSMDRTHNEEVSSRENQITDIRTRITKKREEIANLEVEEKRISGEKLAATQKIETGRARFRIAADALRGEINQELQDVSELVGNPSAATD
ncbi:MAG: hypothetical protein ABIH52_03360 [Candidatus Aenigmatarchaeota archaeon]